MPDAVSLPISNPSPATQPAGLLIAETFASVQGEGALTGVPSFFIRLSGCNLRCRWCDTPYASWNPEGTRQTIDQLIEQARMSKLEHAVLTGGEPMLFSHLCELSTRLNLPVAQGGAGMHITIETAGTIIPADPHWPLTCQLISISPKLRDSTPTNDSRDPDGSWARRHEDRRLNIPILQDLLNRFPVPNRQLKFVVSTPADLTEIEELLARLTGWQNKDILLMPEGIAPPTPEHKAMVLQACLARNWRYCARLHIDLFGHTRGT